MSEKPDLHPTLKDALMRLSRARTDREMYRAMGDEAYKKELDTFLVCCRDLIHEAQMEIPTNNRILHQVQDAIDDFLDHRSKP